MLELHAKLFFRDGMTYMGNTRVCMYDVLGLPEGQKIEIGEHRRKWRIRRPYGKWSDQQFCSAKEALASLMV
jgi:hypothetical protein